MSAQQLKVLQLASGDLWAGAEVQFHALCVALNRLPDVTVKAVVLNQGELTEKLKQQNIDVVIIDETQHNAFSIYQQLCHVIDDYQPDVLHSHREKENVIGSLAARKFSVPSIRSVHGAPEHNVSWLKPHKKLIPFLNTWSGRFIQKKVVSVSKELEQKMSDLFSHSKLMTIENGINTQALIGYQKSPDVRFKGDLIHIGIVGRLVPVKRVDRFIEIANNLISQSSQSFQFHIIGDGPLMDELKNLAHSCGLDHHIKFHGHCHDIHQKIAELDLLLMTSDHEGLPMTLLESLYLGTPVIASEVGAIPEVMRDGELGTLVKPLTVERFTQVIEHSIANRQDIIEKANKAILHIENHYSAQGNAEKFLVLYKQLLKLTIKGDTSNEVTSS